MTVSFHLSPEQEQLKLGARQFAEEHLRPLAAEVAKEPDPLRRALLARPVFEKAVAAGFLKGLIPAPFGGTAGGGVEACILIEEWACQLTYDAFWASGASIGIFAVAAMRQAFDVAYRYALSQKRGGAVPIIDHQSVADVLADAKSRIEAVRLLAWRALDAVIAQDPAGPELALHAKIFGSETGVEVVTRLMNVVGVQAYDTSFPLMAYLADALAYPIIEGSNTGIRRRQLQDLFRTPGYNPLSASGMT